MLAFGTRPDSIASVKGSVQVKLGGRAVAASNVLYVGIAPFNPGLYQVNLVVPADAPDGNLTVDLQIGDQASPAGPFIPVKSAGGTSASVVHRDEVEKAAREEMRLRVVEARTKAAR